MKNNLQKTLLKTGLTNLPENGNCKIVKVKPLTAHQDMNNEAIAPPTYVWDRISKILDQQDSEKMMTRKPVNGLRPAYVAILGGLLAGAAFAITR